LKYEKLRIVLSTYCKRHTGFRSMRASDLVEGSWRDSNHVRKYSGLISTDY
jgi:hypothetical protein